MMLLNSMLGASHYSSSAVAGGAKRDTDKTLIDFDDPTVNLETYMKMVSSLDPTVETAGWFGGTIYAVIGDQQKVQPLIGVEGCGVNRLEKKGENLYHIFNREFAVYKDLKTGRYLDRWYNPLNDETVKVVPIQNMTVNAEIAPVIKQDFDGTIVETTLDSPWIVHGDTVFNVRQLHATFPNPMTPEEWPRESAGPMNRTTEMFQRAASYSELADPSTPHADSTGAWIRVAPWLPWMLMGQSEGHLMYRTFMKRAGPSSNLPAPLLEYMTKNYPDYLSAPPPSAWGSPNDSSFSVYMENNSPAPPKNS